MLRQNIIPFSPQACRYSAGFICFQLCPIHHSEIIKKKWNIETLSNPNLQNKWAFLTKC
ncbi:MAG: hypothetical protein MR279_04205 [Bacteroidales bacterium]|nr:hypothetical protein [Bacteroidales bacterium]